MIATFYYEEGTDLLEQDITVYNLEDLSDIPTYQPVQEGMLVNTVNLTWIGKQEDFPGGDLTDELSTFEDYPYYSDDTKSYGLGMTVLTPGNDFGAVIYQGAGTNSTCRLQEHTQIYLASAYVTNHRYLGFYIIQGSKWAFGYSTSPTNALNLIMNSVDIEPEPGEKGFKPTSSRMKPTKPGIGGRPVNRSKRPLYTTDTITQPGAPDESTASAIGSGFIRAYSVTAANLEQFGKCLFSQNLLDYLSGLRVFVNPLDGVIALSIFPYKPSTGSSEAIKLLNHSCTPADLGYTANGSVLTSQFKQIDFGTLNVYECWGSFLDYTSQAELYLPFIGKVDIDITEIMNGTINVKYTIDYFTGLCVANVLCTKSVELTDGHTVTNYSQHSFQGNCAINIPVTANDYGNLVGSLMNSCFSGLRTGNAGGALISLAGDALSGGLRPSVSTKGSVCSNAGFCSILYPYISIMRPITAEPESYQETVGYPSYIDEYIGQCEGFTVCENVDLRGLSGATDNEINEILRMCKEGIYI